MLVYSISFLAIFLQRKEYDTTGKVLKTVEEEFVDAFGGGKDNPKRTETFIFIDYNHNILYYLQIMLKLNILSLQVEGLLDRDMVVLHQVAVAVAAS